MAINLGNLSVSKAYLGTTQLSQIYLGDDPLLSSDLIVDLSSTGINPKRLYLGIQGNVICYASGTSATNGNLERLDATNYSQLAQCSSSNVAFLYQLSTTGSETETYWTGPSDSVSSIFVRTSTVTPTINASIITTTDGFVTLANRGAYAYSNRHNWNYDKFGNTQLVYYDNIDPYAFRGYRRTNYSTNWSSTGDTWTPDGWVATSDNSQSMALKNRVPPFAWRYANSITTNPTTSIKHAPSVSTGSNLKNGNGRIYYYISGRIQSCDSTTLSDYNLHKNDTAAFVAGANSASYNRNSLRMQYVTWTDTDTDAVVTVLSEPDGDIRWLSYQTGGSTVWKAIQVHSEIEEVIYNPARNHICGLVRSENAMYCYNLP